MAGQGNSSWNISDGDNKWSLDVQRSLLLYYFIIGTVITGTIIVDGIVGNSLAFVVFWKDNIKTSASFLFQSLALVDSALLLLAIPLGPVRYFMVYKNWLKEYLEVTPYLEVYIYPVAIVSQRASVWVVVLLAINRYIAVCFPFKALRWCTISKVKKQLAFVLLCAILYDIPRFADTRIEYVTFDNGTTYIPQAVDTKLGGDRLYYIIYNGALNFVFVMTLPLIILTCVNIRLIQVLKARRRKRMEMVSQRQQNDNNVTLMLVIVVIVFIICEVPDQIGLALVFMPSKHLQPYVEDYDLYLQPVYKMLLVLNSAVNFVIYCLFNKRFRHVLKHTVGCGSAMEVDGRRKKSTRRCPSRECPENGNGRNVEETRL